MCVFERVLLEDAGCWQVLKLRLRHHFKAVKLPSCKDEMVRGYLQFLKWQ